MPIQKEEIIAELEDLYTLINNALTFTPDNLQYFGLCLDSLSVVKVLCKYPSNKEDKTDYSDVYIRLLNIEEFVFSKLDSFLKEVSAKNNSDIFSSPAQTNNFSDFGNLVVAKKKEHDERLHLLHSDNLHKKKPIDQASLSPSNDRKSDASGDQKKIRTKKKKARSALISDAPIDEKLTKLIADISHLEKQLIKTYEDVHQTIEKAPKIDSCFQTDFQIQLLLTAFKTKKAETEAIYQQQNSQITPLKLKREYEILKKELESTIKKLEEFNQTFISLSESIRGRTALIAPKAVDVEILQHHQTKALGTLTSHLEDFLLNLALIDLGDENDADTNFFRKQLSDFINEFFQYLKIKEIPINKDKLNELYNRLLEHLSEKSVFYLFKAPKKPLKTEEVDSFIKNFLAPRQPCQDATTLKNQIASIYDAVARLEAFPGRDIKNYHICKETSKSQKDLFLANHRALAEDIESIKQAFSILLGCFPSTLPVKTEVKNAKADKEKIEAWQHKLTRNYEKYIEQESNAQLINEPLIRLESITHIQQTRLNALEAIKIDFNRHQLCSNRFLKALKKRYESEKNALIIKLVTAIADNEKAFLLIESTDAVEKLLAPFRTYCDELTSKTENLSIVKSEVDSKLQELETHLTKVVEALRTAVYKPLQEITKTYRRFTNPTLDSINPFINDLKSNEEMATAAVDRAHSLYEKLSTTAPADLPEWLNQIEQALQEAEAKVKNRDAILANALEIERRLETKEYIASMAALTTIRREYERILAAKIENALQTSLDDDEKENLKELEHALNKVDAGNFDFNEIDQTLLNKVDPRLYKLFAMYMQFQETNNKYINEDTTRLNDKGYYESLLDNVTTHLRNDHMENISDGKRHQFFQWIRVYIFKPLQTVKHDVDNRVKRLLNAEFQPSHRFFPTIGACKTERELINMGNEVFEQLLQVG
jgi:hypothetical protein